MAKEDPGPFLPGWILGIVPYLSRPATMNKAQHVILRPLCDVDSITIRAQTKIAWGFYIHEWR